MSERSMAIPRSMLGDDPERLLNSSLAETEE